MPALAEAGVLVCGWEQIGDDDRAFLGEVFDTRIFPVLTPLAVDPGHPFPHISSLSLNLAVLVRNPRTGERRFARVKVPPLLPRFVALPDGERFVPLEQIIAARLGELFPGMEVESHCTFRVTRDADLDLEEGEADDLLAAIDLNLRRRRFGEAVRLEIDRGMPTEVRQLLVHELDLHDDDVYEIDGPLDLGGLWALHALDRPDLKDEPWMPVTPPALADIGETPGDIFAVLRERDVLVHHPYESFTASVEAFIRQAAADPNVLAIKQTLYRTSGDSAIVKALIDASEAGKQVVVLDRAQGPLRRDGQHRLGPGPGAGGRPRRLRPGRAQDPHQDGPGRAQRGRRPAPVLPRGHRQLQRQHRPPLRGHRPPHRRRGPHRRPRPPVQLPHRLQPPRAVQAPAGGQHVAAGPARPSSSATRSTTPTGRAGS